MRTNRCHTFPFTGLRPAKSPVNFTESTSTGLLNRVSEHDSAAWSEFVKRYGPWVYEQCRLTGMSDADSEDVTQEVFISVSKKVDDFDRSGPGHGLRRWLVTVARNRIRDFYRERNRTPAGEGGSTALRRLQLVVAPDSNAQQQSPGKVSDMVDRMLRSLRTDCGETTVQAFLMVVGMGMRPTDVAVELGMTPGAVRQAKYWVSKRLRDEYAKRWGLPESTDGDSFYS